MTTIFGPSPDYTTPLAPWLASMRPWTHTLSLKPLDTDPNKWKCPSMEDGLEFRRMVERFFLWLADGVYGEGCWKQPIRHATFFECWSRRRNPTCWHSHSVVMVAPTFVRHFENVAAKKWTRLTRQIIDGQWRTGSIHFAPISDLAGAARYATKFAHTNELLFLDSEDHERSSP